VSRYFVSFCVWLLEIAFGFSDRLF
jgi:hypothetical protein